MVTFYHVDTLFKILVWFYKSYDDTNKLCKNCKILSCQNGLQKQLSKAKLGKISKSFGIAFTCICWVF